MISGKWYVTMELYSSSYVITVRSKQVMLWYLHIPYILQHICCCALVSSAWYLAPCTTSLLSYQAVIPETPVVFSAHITTKLDELNTISDAGRGGWRAT